MVQTRTKTAKGGSAERKRKIVGNIMIRCVQSSNAWNYWEKKYKDALNEMCTIEIQKNHRLLSLLNVRT